MEPTLEAAKATAEFLLRLVERDSRWTTTTELLAAVAEVATETDAGHRRRGARAPLEESW